MTIYELLDWKGKDIKALSESQLTELAMPYFTVTRPDKATPIGSAKVSLSKPAPRQLTEADRKRLAAIERGKMLAKALGI